MDRGCREILHVAEFPSACRVGHISRPSPVRHTNFFHPSDLRIWIITTTTDFDHFGVHNPDQSLSPTVNCRVVRSWNPSVRSSDWIDEVSIASSTCRNWNWSVGLSSVCDAPDITTKPADLFDYFLKSPKSLIIATHDLKERIFDVLMTYQNEVYIRL